MSYYGCCLTADGKALIAKLLASKGELVISGVQVGKGVCPDDTYPGTLTALIDPVADATVTVPVYEQDTVTMTVQYRNDLNGGLEEGFFLSEFGIFADDPDEGQILLYYGSLGDEPEYVRAYSTGAIIVRDYPVSITVGEGADAQITINSAAWVTAAEVAEYVESVAATKKEIDFTILTYDWDILASPTSKYTWYADIQNDDILVSHIPDVVLNIEDMEAASAAGLCTTVQALEGGILRFYAQAKPDADISGRCILWGGSTGAAVYGTLDVASSTTLGGVRVQDDSGLTVDSDDGDLWLDTASEEDVTALFEEDVSQSTTTEE